MNIDITPHPPHPMPPPPAPSEDGPGMGWDGVGGVISIFISILKRITNNIGNPMASPTYGLLKNIFHILDMAF